MTTICENNTEWNIRDFYKAVSECHSTLNTVHDDAQKDFYKTLMKTAELTKKEIGLKQMHGLSEAAIGAAGLFAGYQEVKPDGSDALWFQKETWQQIRESLPLCSKGIAALTDATETINTKNMVQTMINVKQAIASHSSKLNDDLAGAMARLASSQHRGG
jgi:hypothetical protein